MQKVQRQSKEYMVWFFVTLIFIHNIFEYCFILINPNSKWQGCEIYQMREFSQIKPKKNYEFSIIKNIKFEIGNEAMYSYISTDLNI